MIFNPNNTYVFLIELEINFFNIIVVRVKLNTYAHVNFKV